MDAEMQAKIWALLPPEYRKEVKGLYASHTERQSITSQDTLLDKLFGKDNLTSEDEPREMLSVAREDVVRMYGEAYEQSPCGKHYGMASYEIAGEAKKETLTALFGNKCYAPGEKPVLRPKFAVGQVVESLVYCGWMTPGSQRRITEVIVKDNGVFYRVDCAHHPELEFPEDSFERVYPVKVYDSGTRVVNLKLGNQVCVVEEILTGNKYKLRDIDGVWEFKDLRSFDIPTIKVGAKYEIDKRMRCLVKGVYPNGTVLVVIPQTEVVCPVKNLIQETPPVND